MAGDEAVAKGGPGMTSDGAAALWDMFFDPDWYARWNDDVPPTAEGARRHFATIGLDQGRWPGPLFDPDWYLMTYADVRSSGIPAFQHFCSDGWNEGRLPGPWAEAALRHLASAEAPTTDPDQARLRRLRRATEMTKPFVTPRPSMPLSADELRWYWAAMGPCPQAEESA